MDPGTAKRFTIQLDDARDLPEVLRYSAAGFCHVVSETACDAKLSIRHERVRPDQILITRGASPAAPLERLRQHPPVRICSRPESMGDQP